MRRRNPTSEAQLVVTQRGDYSSTMVRVKSGPSWMAVWEMESHGPARADGSVDVEFSARATHYAIHLDGVRIYGRLHVDGTIVWKSASATVGHSTRNVPVAAAVESLSTEIDQLIEIESRHLPTLPIMESYTLTDWTASPPDAVAATLWDGRRPR